jgi:hypothetical protein
VRGRGDLGVVELVIVIEIDAGADRDAAGGAVCAPRLGIDAGA